LFNAADVHDDQVDLKGSGGTLASSFLEKLSIRVSDRAGHSPDALVTPEWIYVSFLDSGPGFPDHVIERFDQRTAGPLKSKKSRARFGGEGRHLQEMRRRLEELGARMEFSNGALPDFPGACVTIALPMARGEGQNA